MAGTAAVDMVAATAPLAAVTMVTAGTTTRTSNGIQYAKSGPFRKFFRKGSLFFWLCKFSVAKFAQLRYNQAKY